MIDHNELLPEGRELGGFRIEKAIGHGNMGIIYRAIQINLNRPVALKVLFKSVANDQDFVRSFFREAQAAAAFTHQNIVQAFDVGQSDDGIYYFAMELIDGGDISLQLKIRGRYEPVEALEMMIGVADGLDYGSTLRKLTHGDIKPANIMITKAGRFKLADLGLARMGGEIQGESDGIMLTPLYAAPEMINGSWEVGDPRADMYSFGATLYHMMYGEPPFYDDDYQKVIQMQLSYQHQSLKDVLENFPSNISKLVDRFLEKDPDKRFSSWGEAKQAMEQVVKDPHGSHTKKKKKVIHYHQPHSKDDDEDSDSHVSHRSHTPRKKSSAAPFIIGLVALLVIGGLGFFALNMKKDVVGKEYKQLTTRFEGKKPESVIKMIEKFVERHGTTPPEAAKDLEKYREILVNRSLFSTSDLSYQSKKIQEFESQYVRKNPVVSENFRFNLSRIESDLNSTLQNNGMIFHLPFNDTITNHADFYSPPKIKVNHGSIEYITAQVDKGIEFTGQSILYGDINRLRFSNNSKFTISFWINPKAKDFPILGKCEIDNGKISRGYLISLSEGKLLCEFFENSDDKKLAVKTNKELSDSNWNHVVITYDGNSPAISLNGSETEVESLSSSLSGDFACTGPFVVGFKNMKATLDDIRIWNRNLNEKELNELNKYRSISELEKVTGQYQDIKTKIQSMNLNINSEGPKKTDPDVGPPDNNNDGIKHPDFRKYVDTLQKMKANPGLWEENAAEAAGLSQNIGRDIPEHEKRMSIFAKHVRNADQRFYSLLSETKELKGTQVTTGPCKGFEFVGFGNGSLVLRETSRIGRILHIYDIKMPKSVPAINGVINIMLIKGMLKEDSPEVFIFATIMGYDMNYRALKDNGRFPVLVEGLYNDLGGR